MSDERWSAEVLKRNEESNRLAQDSLMMRTLVQLQDGHEGEALQTLLDLDAKGRQRMREYLALLAEALESL